MQSASFSPILYSFRRCPYAIRARMALSLSRITPETREIALKNKPAAMLVISSKGTVPVLQLGENEVLAESLEIMRFALAHPATSQQVQPLLTAQYFEALLLGINSPEQLTTDLALIISNDSEFKPWLDKYKYADRYPEQDAVFYRQQGEEFIAQLEHCLAVNAKNITAQPVFLGGQCPSLSDLAIFPFIRQFALVDMPWFNHSHYHYVQAWLTYWLDSPLFEFVMLKVPCWHDKAEMSLNDNQAT